MKMAKYVKLMNVEDYIGKDHKEIFNYLLDVKKEVELDITTSKGRGLSVPIKIKWQNGDYIIESKPSGKSYIDLFEHDALEHLYIDIGKSMLLGRVISKRLNTIYMLFQILSFITVCLLLINGFISIKPLSPFFIIGSILFIITLIIPILE